MPADLVFHEGNALTLDGFCPDQSGFVPDLFRFIDCLQNLFHIMTIDRNHVPVESPELGIDRAEGMTSST